MLQKLSGPETERPVIRKGIQFYGRVQGIGFCYRANHAASAVSATGWVRNEYDGSVTMEIQATEADIDRVIETWPVSDGIPI